MNFSNLISVSVASACTATDTHDLFCLVVTGLFFPAGSVVVIISALVVWLTEWEYSAYIDPALSLCLVSLITASTWPLLKVSALILLQTVPTHIQVKQLNLCLQNSVTRESYQFNWFIYI